MGWAVLACALWPTTIPVAAAEPLVHDGSAELALEAALEVAIGRPLEPVAFGALLQHPPVLRSGGLVVGCVQAPLRFSEALEAVTSGVLYSEPDLQRRFERARAAAVCDGADADGLSRLGFLEGIAALEAGDEAAARDAWRMALRRDPQLGWDPDYAPELQRVFDAVASEPTPASVRFDVIPGIEVAIDGREASAPIAALPGEHLLELSGAGRHWITLPEAPDALVVPAAFPPDALGWMADDRREQLSALLAATLGEGIRATVVVDGQTWTGTTGRIDWIQLDTAQPPVPIGARRRRAPVAMVLGGAALSVVGGGLAAQAWAVGVAEPGASDALAWSRARDRYWAGHAVSAGGLTLAGAGVIWAVGAR